MAFRFRLSPLQKYREHQRDVCRQLLAKALAEDAELVRRREELLVAREALLQEIVEMQHQGRYAVDQVSARRYHAAQLQTQARQLEAEREVVAERIRLCRQALVMADQGVKVLERLSEQQLREFEKLAEAKEARQREEAWLASRHLRSE